MLQKSDKTRGFSFLEIMLVVSLIMVFFGMSLKLYSDFNWQKKLEAETKKLVARLELAKKKAASGDKSELDISCTLSGYKVTYTANSYHLLARCPTDTGLNVDYYLDSAFSLSGDGTGEVVFSPFGIGATPSCVVITNTKNSKCRKITIDQSAVITYGAESGACLCP